MHAIFDVLKKEQRPELNKLWLFCGALSQSGISSMTHLVENQ